jgi:hypothetical protein
LITWFVLILPLVRLGLTFQSTQNCTASYFCVLSYRNTSDSFD